MKALINNSACTLGTVQRPVVGRDGAMHIHCSTNIWTCETIMRCHWLSWPRSWYQVRLIQWLVPSGRRICCVRQRPSDTTSCRGTAWHYAVVQWYHTSPGCRVDRPRDITSCRETVRCHVVLHHRVTSHDDTCGADRQRDTTSCKRTMHPCMRDVTSWRDWAMPWRHALCSEIAWRCVEKLCNTMSWRGTTRRHMVQEVLRDAISC